MNLTPRGSAKISETQISLSLPGDNMSSLHALYLCAHTDRGQDGDKEDDADDTYKLMVSFGGFKPYITTLDLFTSSLEQTTVQLSAKFLVYFKIKHILRGQHGG